MYLISNQIDFRHSFYQSRLEEKVRGNCDSVRCTHSRMPSYEIRIEVLPTGLQETLSRLLSNLSKANWSKNHKAFPVRCIIFAKCPIAVRADEKSLYAISEIDSVRLIVPIFNIWVNTNRVIFNGIQSITEKACGKNIYLVRS